MNRRLIAAIVAAVLALAGGAALYTYVNNADKRAMAGMDTSDVLVVVTDIAKGTPASAVTASQVAVKRLPKAAITDGAVTSLTALNAMGNKLAQATMIPGEQVLATKFVDASQVEGDASVPKGMQELSFLLTSSRADGGVLKAGDKVGFFATVEAEGSTAAPQSGQIKVNAVTRMIVARVLVTRVQGALAQPSAGPSANSTAAPAQDSAYQAPLMITVAVSAADAAKVIMAVEKAQIYLTLQNDDAQLDSAPVFGEVLFR